MTETFCAYSKDRDALLVAYLYDDIEPADRVRFDAHMAVCARCRAELEALSGVRRELAQWSPPEFSKGTAVPHNGRWWAIPAWAQVAAAMLCLGVGAGLANLDVRYDHTGVTVRTGWARGAQGSQGSQGSQGGSGAQANSAPWRADLTALEQSLRDEWQAGLRTTQAARPVPAPARVSAPADAEVPPQVERRVERRVRALLDESEKRQQRELALRVADVMRDLDTQRRADLTKIDRSLGVIQNNAGVEVLKQRELLNYLVRASQSK